MNYTLNEEDFKHLTRGGVLILGDNKLILSDIGFLEMEKAIIDARTKGVDYSEKPINKKKHNTIHSRNESYL